jgi:regulator of cell morphogenesis and NO signaling
MTIIATKTVKEVAIEFPYATRVFEKLGIDYCCGGGKSLQDACAGAGVTFNELVSLLESAAPQTSREINWQARSLSELGQYVLDKHHVYTKEALTRLKNLLAKVCSVHGENHPELMQIKNLFQDLSNELVPHMFKEEQILFPYIFELDQAAKHGRSVDCPFGSVANPIQMMKYEHESAGELLRKMRQLSHQYVPPPDACISYQTLYQAMAELEQDLHEHIHLENNILFPGAEALERVPGRAVVS